MSGSRVVVGVDGSPASLRALWVAVEEARGRHADLVVVNAPTILGRAMPALSGGIGPATTVLAGTLTTEEAERGRLLIEDALIELFGGHPGDVSISSLISDLSPVSALINAVGPQDLLVVGRSRTGFGRRLLSASISELCAAAAPCPVLVVPPPEEPKRSYPRGRFRRRSRSSR